MLDSGRSANREGMRTSRDIDYRKNVEVLMKQLSWSIGPNKIPKDLLPWSETAVELRR